MSRSQSCSSLAERSRVSPAYWAADRNRSDHLSARLDHCCGLKIGITGAQQASGSPFQGGTVCMDYWIDIAEVKRLLAHARRVLADTSHAAQMSCRPGPF